jgi:alpha-1,4-galacturonosyltransferase
MKHMEASLSSVGRAFSDCSLVSKLQAVKRKTEEQVRFQRSQATYLVHLAVRTAQKSFHCLSMRLTAEYFSLRPEERKLPNENKIHHPDLYHYAVFSDNVLACAVVVNSTVSTAKVNTLFIRI